MRFFYLSIIALAGVISVTSCKKHQQGQDSSADSYVSSNVASKGAMMAPYQRTENADQGRVVVKFKRQYQPSGPIAMGMQSAARVGVSNVDALVEDLGVNNIRRVFPYSERMEPITRKHGLDLWYVVEYDQTKASLRSAVEKYSLLEELEWVETSPKASLINEDAIMYPLDGILKNALMASKSADAAALPFNDEYLHRQWWLQSDNATKPNVDPRAGIDAYKAWQKTAGAPDIIVSVHDGGIQWDHVDLADNVFVSESEILYNNTDDDGNGYVDDRHGYDFVQVYGEIELKPHNHGTHVGGIIAAVNNNGKGISSIAGGTGNNDGVKLLSCQLFKGAKSATNDKMAESFHYAVSRGAIISQNSWGYGKEGGRSKVVEDAIDFFIAEAGNPELFPDSPMKGGIVIFSSGNDGKGSVQQYPGYYEPIVSVAASTEFRRLADYSTRGDGSDITAPGGSDDMSPADEASNYMILSCFAGKTIFDKSEYGYMSGTSQACPLVSGVAAILVDAYRGSTNTKIKELLLSSTVSFADTDPGNAADGGSGLLNASVHIKSEANNVASNAISDLELSKIEGSEDMQLSWTVPSNSAQNWNDKYYVYYSTKEFDQSTLGDLNKVIVTKFSRVPVGRKVSIALSELEGINASGSLYLAVSSVDMWGNVSSISNLVSMGGSPEGGSPAGSLSDQRVTDSINFVFDAQLKQLSKHIKINDRSGRVVISCDVAPGTDYTINSSKLSVGAYTYMIINKDNNQQIEKGQFYKL